MSISEINPFDRRLDEIWDISTPDLKYKDVDASKDNILAETQ